MASGDRTVTWSASSNLTVTNLHSLATSSTHVNGWESAEIDGTGYSVCFVTAKIVVAAAGLSAGEIRLWVVPRLDDSNYPGGFDGTESTETAPLDDEGGTAGGAILLKGVTTDTTASQTYYFHPVNVTRAFDGILPKTFVLFITQSTGANLAAAGNQVTIKLGIENIAP